MATFHGSPPCICYTEFLEENKLVYTYLDAGAHSDPRGGWEGPNQRQATKLHVRRARRLGQLTTQHRHKYACLRGSSASQPQITQLTQIIDILMHFLQGITWPPSTWIHIPDRPKSAVEPGWTNVLVVLFTTLSISWPTGIVYNTYLFSCERKMVYCIDIFVIVSTSVKS